MMGICKFTAAACGVDGTNRLWAQLNCSSKGERCSIIREDCHQNFSTTQTNTTSTCITSQKKEKLYPFSIIKPLLKTTFFSSSLSTLLSSSSTS